MSVPDDVSGHKLFCEPPIGGQSRRTCVVIHRDHRACILGEPVFVHHAAALALRAPAGGVFWLITAHLDPNRAVHRYQTSLDNPENFLVAASLGASILASIDANVSLALPDSTPTATVGPPFAGHASHKGSYFGLSWWRMGSLRQIPGPSQHLVLRHAFMTANTPPSRSTSCA